MSWLRLRVSLTSALPLRKELAYWKEGEMTQAPSLLIKP